MSTKYTIDGRDPNAKGYVKEDRMANQQETDKIVVALESFGYKNVEDYKFHLFGRLDDVHGWYLFGISKEDDEREDYLILGDCLDVLEEPYNKVLGLDEVMEFARNFGSGDNVGTAYDAMQTWGVFNSLSQGFCEEDDALVESRECVERKNVWVLTIYKDEQFFPEVHRTFEGALDGAVNDIAEHMEEDEVDDYDWAKIRTELASQHYWHDDIKDVVYDIAECVIGK